MISLQKHRLVLYFSFSAFIFVSRGAKGEQHHFPNITWALFGKTARLECMVGQTNSEFTVAWTSNGDSILHHKSDKGLFKTTEKFESVIKNDKSVASLVIANIAFQDAGKYDCSVVFHSEGKSQSNSWIVTVQGQPRMTISPLLVENKPTTVECCVELAFVFNRSEMQMMWRMNGEIIHSEIFEVQNGTSSVTVKIVCSHVTLILTRQHHERMLQCFVRNELHAAERVRLNVTYFTNADVIVGSSYNPSDAVKVRKDEIVNITCIFQGYPSPNISLQMRDMGNNWINIPMKTYPVKRNIPMTSQTFLYKSNEEKSVRFRCTAYNSFGLTTQSKEFQIEVLDSVDSQDPNIIQTVIVVCVGLTIVGALIMRHCLKDNSSRQLKLSKLRVNGESDTSAGKRNILNRGRYSMGHRDTSQKVPDVCRHSPDVKVTDNSVFYNVLESEEYEVVETGKDRRQSDDFISVDTGNATITYAKVKKMSWTANSLKEAKRIGNVSSDIEETLPTYAEVRKSK